MHDEVKPAERSSVDRIYLDAVLSSSCFFLLSLAVGKISRAPFDDEMYALRFIERFNPLEIFREMWGVGVHPPFWYAVFSLAYQIVPDPTFLRLFSLICTTLSIFFFHQMFVNVGVYPALGDRLIAVFAFSSIPLLLQFGDAIRWYPIFMLFFSLLIVTLVRRPDATWVPAGLLGALSFVNAEGFLIALSVGVYRYGFERRRIFGDLRFIGLSACFQALVIPYYYAIFMSPPESRLQEYGIFAKRGLQDYYETVVGYFGGYAFGIGLAWVLLPILAVTGLALVQLIRRFSETDAVERLALITLGLTAVWATIWTNAYAFTYAALMMTYIILKVLSRTNSPAVKAVVMATFLLTNGTAMGNLQGSAHPFQRTYPAPYREMAAAISANFAAGDLVISTDPNLVTLLDAGIDCVQLFNDVLRAGPDCPRKREGEEQFDRPPKHLLLIEGRRNLVELFNTSAKGKTIRWEDVVRNLTAGRRLVASIPYKYDADAALKTRLSGETLGSFVFIIKIFE